MTSRLNEVNSQFAPPVAEPAVAKSLSELPKQDKRKVTTELLRIHNLVNALDSDLSDWSDKDKADNKPVA